MRAAVAMSAVPLRRTGALVRSSGLCKCPTHDVRYTGRPEANKRAQRRCYWVPLSFQDVVMQG